MSDLTVPVPHYRYSIVVAQAKDMVSTASDLGAALLSALESRDAEQLAILQNTHEKIVLKLTTTIKTFELDEAAKTKDALEISHDNIKHKKEFYEGLFSKGKGFLALNDEEIAELVLMAISKTAKGTSSALTAIASGTAQVPDVASGGAGISSPLLVTTWGGSKLSDGLGHAAEVIEILAEVLEMSADMSGKIGEYKRRVKEWEHEKKTAEYDLQEIKKQIEVATVQIEKAKQELELHKTAIAQNQEIADFYRSKFSNEALYNWMVGRLSGLYFQAYKVAYDMAKSAEKALQFELPTTNSYISFGHWDSLKKGLLAGESLMLELNRMEKSHLDQDSRFLEIEKTISMAKSMPTELSLLKRNGVCQFRLSERLFNQDYPGHYCRLIKTIALSIKTEREEDIDPYESIHATLIQVGNKTLLSPDSNAVSYLMGIEGAEQPDFNTVRTNWRANQQIAISKPVEDLGMFNLDFIFDNRYFPFESTGAVSDWRFEMLKDTNHSLLDPKSKQFDKVTDVIIHLRYTAKSDTGTFRTAVQNLMKTI